MSLICGCDEDGPSVFNQRYVEKSRKEYKCYECRELIPIGSAYKYVFGVWDGDALTFHICEKCGDLQDSLEALGFCTELGELKNSYSEYREYMGLARKL